MSRLDYYNSLLAGLSLAGLDRLQHIENKVVRIKRLPWRAHVSAARVELHWLPIFERIVYKLVSLVYSTLATDEPEYLSDLLTCYVPERCVRSMHDTTRLVVPFVRTKLAEGSFSYAGPAAWNDLPQALRERDSLNSFKTALKEYLFVRSLLVID